MDCRPTGLQLISLAIGKWFIRLFGISVVDLGSYQLQVVKVCGALRYLFPLMTLGVHYGVLFATAVVDATVVFLSTVQARCL